MVNQLTLYVYKDSGVNRCFRCLYVSVLNQRHLCEYKVKRQEVLLGFFLQKQCVLVSGGTIARIPSKLNCINIYLKNNTHPDHFYLRTKDGCIEMHQYKWVNQYEDYIRIYRCISIERCISVERRIKIKRCISIERLSV